MAVCKSCGAELVEGAAFCMKCGAKVEVEAVCPNCGEKLLEGAAFCMKCGTKVAEPVPVDSKPEEEPETEEAENEAIEEEVRKEVVEAEKEAVVPEESEEIEETEVDDNTTEETETIDFASEEPEETSVAQENEPESQKTSSSDHVLSQLNGKTVYTGKSSAFEFKNPKISIYEDGITIFIDAVVNKSTWDTADLRLNVWLASEKYNGGTLNGQCIASFDYSYLKSTYQFSNINKTAFVPFNVAAGSYYVIITMNEFCSDGKNYIMSWFNFNKMYEKIVHKNIQIKQLTGTFNNGGDKCSNCKKVIAKYNMSLACFSPVDNNVVTIKMKGGIFGGMKDYNFCSVDCARKFIDKKN